MADYITRDAGWQPFFESVTNMLKPLIPRFSQEGKSYLTIGVGCTGGRHRSVFAAEAIAEWLRNQGLACLANWRLYSLLTAIGGRE